jgi:hypothetical protein
MRQVLRGLGICLWVIGACLAMSAKVMGVIVLVIITMIAFLSHFVPKD